MRLESSREKIFYQWPAKVLSLVAAILLYLFITLFGLERYEISVPITYLFPNDLVTTKVNTQKVILHFKGTKEKIDYLKSLNLNASDFSVVVEIPKNAKLGPIKLPVHTKILTGGNDLHDFGYESSEPGDVELDLDKADFKKVTVVPVIIGKPRSGYDVASYSVIPNEITIKGSSQQLSLLDSVETEPISIDGREQSLTQNVHISGKDHIISAVESSGILVRVEIKPTLETLVYNDLPIELVDLPPGLRLETPLPRGSVKLRDLGSSLANNPVLITKPNTAPRLFIIASNFVKPGSYAVSVVIDSDPRFEIVDRNPKNLEINLVAGE